MMAGTSAGSGDLIFIFKTKKPCPNCIRHGHYTKSIPAYGFFLAGVTF
jgi:hypothetical protein